MKRPNDRPDYSGALTAQWDSNLNDFSIQDPYVVEKLVKLGARIGKSPDDILNLPRNQLFGLLLVKDPIKQGIHEKEAAGFINGWINYFMDVVEDIDIDPLTVLPKHGSESLKIIGGVVMRPEAYKALGPEYKKVKTVDFHSQILACRGKFEGIIDIYASHKHTEGSGGAQDNQYTDLEIFLNECQAASDDTSSLFLAIADGSYYQKRDADGNTPIDILRVLYGADNIVICTSEELMSGNLLLHSIVDIIS